MSISKRYGSRVALDSMSLDIVRGSIHGILGPNGSGKTTALHIITGLANADSGSVTISGHGIEGRNSRSFFGFAPDDLPLPGTLTGREYLYFHDALRSRDDSKTAMLLAGAFAIEDDLDKLVADYSHGMHRKLQLIAATMHTPDLLILDEPFRGLDPEAGATLKTMIRSFAGRGSAVLIATHDMLRAERDCDNVSILSHGSVVANGSPSTLIDRRGECTSLEDVFMEVTGRNKTLSRNAARLEKALSGSTYKEI